METAAFHTLLKRYGMFFVGLVIMSFGIAFHQGGAGNLSGFQPALCAQPVHAFERGDCFGPGKRHTDFTADPAPAPSV